MKTLAVIDGLCSGVWRPGGRVGGIPHDLLEKLCAIYPQGRTGNMGHCFRSNLLYDDDRTVMLLRELENAGLRPWPMRGRRRDSEYTLRLQRIYDESDLDESQYLEIRPQGVRGVWRRPADKSLVLKEPSTEWDIVAVCRPYCYAVVERAKQALELSGMRNLVFLPAQKAYESVDYGLYDEDDMWWELRSDRILPPLAKTMTLEHKDHTPFTGDFSRGCMRREGFYTHAELHYKRDLLDAVKPFDLAHTYEMFEELPSEDDRPLVASEHFYEVCKEHDIRAKWVPVRVDD